MNHDVVFNQCGIRQRHGASNSSLDQLAATFRCKLPADFRALWSWSDGGDASRIRLLSVTEISDYSDIWQDDFGYVPFGDCNDSNPYVVRCRPPLYGFVVRVSHDGEPRLICRGLSRFFDLLEGAIRQDKSVDDLAGDWPTEVASRSVKDSEDARELLSAVESIEIGDEWRRQALDFAIQLLGPGCERDLARVLATGDEYNRETVLQRCHHLNTTAARELITQDSAEFQAFVASLEAALNVAGMRTDRDGRGELRLQPGNQGLNLPLIYCDFRCSGDLDVWVERLVSEVNDG